MSNFGRRLDSLQRRPSFISLASETSAVAVSDGSSGLGWQAAERISRLVSVEPGTVIKVAVEGGCDSAVLEVSWDADGVAAIREL